MTLYETERLIVREWTSADINDFIAYNLQPDVMKFMDYPMFKNSMDAENCLKTAIGYYNPNFTTNKRYMKIDYAIELKSNFEGAKKVVGSISFAKITPEAGGVIEMGYMLNKNFQHKGYMTEAVQGLFKFIKEKNLAKRIETSCDTENKASEAVMKRTGMTFEGIRRKSLDNNFRKRADYAVYSILDEEIKS